jgi:hypothetical protein
VLFRLLTFTTAEVWHKKNIQPINNTNRQEIFEGGHGSVPDPIQIKAYPPGSLPEKESRPARLRWRWKYLTVNGAVARGQESSSDSIRNSRKVNLDPQQLFPRHSIKARSTPPRVGRTSEFWAASWLRANKQEFRCVSHWRLSTSNQRGNSTPPRLSPRLQAFKHLYQALLSTSTVHSHTPHTYNRPHLNPPTAPRQSSVQA